MHDTYTNMILFAYTFINMCMYDVPGSMKSRALAMATKISSLILSGMPNLRMNSVTLSSSCSSMKGWPSNIMGSSGGAVCSFSCTLPRYGVSIHMKTTKIILTFQQYSSYE